MFKQLHFKSLLLMLCMTLGAGHAWAQQVTLDFTSNDDWELPTATGTKDEGSFTDGNGYTITLTASNAYYFNSGMYLMLGKSGSTLTLPAFNFNVSKIVVTGKSGASGSVKQNIYVGETAVSTETTGATGANTYEIASDNQAAGTIYTLKVTSAHNTQITKIEVFEAGAAVSPELSIDASTITIGGTATISTNGPALTLSTNDASIASVNGSTITGVAAGEVTITASWSAGTVDGVDYTAGSEDFTINVITITDGVFDFTLGYAYGSGLTPNNDGSYVTETKTWTAGNITLVTSGKYRWWSTDGTLRVFDSGDTENPTAITLSAPEGKVITALALTGSNLTGITSDKGTYSEGSWTGSAQTVVFTRSSANAQIKTITVTYDDAPSIVAPEFSLAGGYYNGTQSVTLSTETEGATIYYTTDGTEPTAESTEYTGAISVSATTTIKAVTVKDETLSVVESATYVIVAHDGTLESPFTVAEANEILNAGFKPTNVYVSGIISQIDEVSTANGNATYWISDDGTTTDQLEIYRGKSYDGEAFTSEDEIAVGDAVTVYGSLTIYGTTNEFKQGSSIVRPTTPDAPVLGIEGVSAELIANVYFKTAQSISVTATDGATVYYTTDGTDPTTESSVYDATAGITLDKSATVKAIAVLGTVTSEVASLNVSIYTKGDVSEDGKVSLGDVTELINILLSE